MFFPEKAHMLLGSRLIHMYLVSHLNPNQRNRWDGSGTYVGADGSSYTGSFKTGKRHSKGIDVR